MTENEILHLIDIAGIFSCRPSRDLDLSEKPSEKRPETSEIET